MCFLLFSHQSKLNIRYDIVLSNFSLLCTFLNDNVSVSGVLFSLLWIPLNKQERIISMLVYTPKATVQDAFGFIPLSMELSCGPLVLIVYVISILLTTLLGTFCIDHTASLLLKKEFVV